MSFKTLSNAQLVADTKRAMSEERQATLAVLDRLREIHSRSVHLQMGFTSLHEFCVAELRYSDGAAHRLIGAFRRCGFVMTYPRPGRLFQREGFL